MITDKEKRAAIKKYKQGLPVNKIVAPLKVSRQTFYTWLKPSDKKKPRSKELTRGNVVLRLPNYQIKQLNAIAKRKGITRTELIEKALITQLQLKVKV